MNQNLLPQPDESAALESELEIAEEAMQPGNAGMNSIRHLPKQTQTAQVEKTHIQHLEHTNCLPAKTPGTITARSGAI